MAFAAAPETGGASIAVYLAAALSIGGGAASAINDGLKKKPC